MKYSLPGALLVLLLASCSEKKEALSENEINARVDSLVAVKMDELNKFYMDDLEKRKAIEVKAKADSIVQAMTSTTPPADNTGVGNPGE